ncbi:MAG: DUF2975 domain-containing protein [Verrucomicrobia bacterium]|nr:DUF2975 domain-containing protein [Verrucomicrobiota bacterium]
MKTKFTLLRYLAALFRLTQVFIAIGLVGMVVFVPLYPGLVDSQRGSAGIFLEGDNPGFFVSGDSAGWTFLSSLNSGNSSPFRFVRPSGLPSYGSFSLGPVKLKNATNQFSVNSIPTPDSGVTFNNLSGFMTFSHPKNTGALVAPLTAPFVVSMLVNGLFLIALLECLQRVFRSVGEDEVFSEKNLRRVRMIGWLFVISSVLRVITGGWLMHRMTELVRHAVPLNGMSIESTIPGDITPFLTGVVILGLAEVFRQGLRLREENSLTI